MSTNNLTRVYEGLVIDRAKRNYLQAFKIIFPDRSHYTLKNISVSRIPGYNDFTLHMRNKMGCVIHEESFCFSDF